ncbi:hypothetical protein [Hymenobacter actinosclerus]|uniref:Uncharacterized protein n=1 Tax=Hymenobacter actinosclerus TaxID=82805 RepID=A0A1I0BL68_9BACT|nr:hypothetical protein [Hymenobacter actinosclerus]SET07017.1 hypothetical protein SAMN04487998_1093 [Hymenobacter actinosclerus]
MKSFTNLLLGSLTFLAVASCSKDDEKVTPTSGPREYNVEYKITSSTGSQADFVLYYNETGGQSQFADVKLPVTYKFKRTMKAGDITSIGASLANTTANSEITTTILLDGKQVDTKTARGTGLATAIYIIGQP